MLLKVNNADEDSRGRWLHTPIVVVELATTFTPQVLNTLHYSDKRILIVSPRVFGLHCSDMRGRCKRLFPESTPLQWCR